MAQLFRWKHPIILLEKVWRYLVALSFANHIKRDSNWYTYANPRPGQCLTHAQSHIIRALADSSLDPGASLSGIIKIWKSTATNQSAWYSCLIHEPRTPAPGYRFNSMLMTDSLPILHKCSLFQGRGLLSHLRSCFDSWASANYILCSHLVPRVCTALSSCKRDCVHISSYGFNHSHWLITVTCWFHYFVEVLVTVRSNIYYLSDPLIAKVYEQVLGLKMFSFLRPLSAFYECSRNAKPQTSTAKARARYASANRETGF